MATKKKGTPGGGAANNFLISVVLNDLKQLTSLREELSGIMAALDKPVSLQINIPKKTKEALDQLKGVGGVGGRRRQAEEQEEPPKRTRRRAAGADNSGYVTSDQMSRYATGMGRSAASFGKAIVMLDNEMAAMRALIGTAPKAGAAPKIGSPRFATSGMERSLEQLKGTVEKVREVAAGGNASLRGLNSGLKALFADVDRVNKTLTRRTQLVLVDDDEDLPPPPSRKNTTTKKKTTRVSRTTAEAAPRVEVLVPETAESAAVRREREGAAVRDRQNERRIKALQEAEAAAAEASRKARTATPQQQMVVQAATAVSTILTNAKQPGKRGGLNDAAFLDTDHWVSQGARLQEARRNRTVAGRAEAAKVAEEIQRDIEAKKREYSNERDVFSQQRRSQPRTIVTSESATSIRQVKKATAQMSEAINEAFKSATAGLVAHAGTLVTLIEQLQGASGAAAEKAVEQVAGGAPSDTTPVAPSRTAVSRTRKKQATTAEVQVAATGARGLGTGNAANVLKRHDEALVKEAKQQAVAEMTTVPVVTAAPTPKRPRKSTFDEDAFDLAIAKVMKESPQLTGMLRTDRGGAMIEAARIVEHQARTKTLPQFSPEQRNELRNREGYVVGQLRKLIQQISNQRKAAGEEKEKFIDLDDLPGFGTSAEYGSVNAAGDSKQKIQGFNDLAAEMSNTPEAAKEKPPRVAMPAGYKAGALPPGFSKWMSQQKEINAAERKMWLARFAHIFTLAPGLRDVAATNPYAAFVGGLDFAQPLKSDESSPGHQFTDNGRDSLFNGTSTRPNPVVANRIVEGGKSFEWEGYLKQHKLVGPGAVRNLPATAAATPTAAIPRLELPPEKITEIARAKAERLARERAVSTIISKDSKLFRQLQDNPDNYRAVVQEAEKRLDERIDRQQNPDKYKDSPRDLKAARQQGAADEAGMLEYWATKSKELGYDASGEVNRDSRIYKKGRALRSGMRLQRVVEATMRKRAAAVRSRARLKQNESEMLESGFRETDARSADNPANMTEGGVEDYFHALGMEARASKQDPKEKRLTKEVERGATDLAQVIRDNPPFLVDDKLIESGAAAAARRQQRKREEKLAEYKATPVVLNDAEKARAIEELKRQYRAGEQLAAPAARALAAAARDSGQGFREYTGTTDPAAFERANAPYRKNAPRENANVYSGAGRSGRVAIPVREINDKQLRLLGRLALSEIEAKTKDIIAQPGVVASVSDWHGSMPKADQNQIFIDPKTKKPIENWRDLIGDSHTPTRKELRDASQQDRARMRQEDEHRNVIRQRIFEENARRVEAGEAPLVEPKYITSGASRRRWAAHQRMERTVQTEFLEGTSSRMFVNPQGQAEYRTETGAPSENPYRFLPKTVITPTTNWMRGVRTSLRGLAKNPEGEKATKHLERLKKLGEDLRFGKFLPEMLPADMTNVGALDAAAKEVSDMMALLTRAKKRTALKTSRGNTWKPSIAPHQVDWVNVGGRLMSPAEARASGIEVGASVGSQVKQLADAGRQNLVFQQYGKAERMDLELERSRLLMAQEAAPAKGYAAEQAAAGLQYNKYLTDRGGEWVDNDIPVDKRSAAFVDTYAARVAAIARPDSTRRRGDVTGVTRLNPQADPVGAVRGYAEVTATALEAAQAALVVASAERDALLNRKVEPRDKVLRKRIADARTKLVDLGRNTIRVSPKLLPLIADDDKIAEVLRAAGFKPDSTNWKQGAEVLRTGAYTPENQAQSRNYSKLIEPLIQAVRSRPKLMSPLAQQFSQQGSTKVGNDIVTTDDAMQYKVSGLDPRSEERKATSSLILKLEKELGTSGRGEGPDNRMTALHRQRERRQEALRNAEIAAGRARSPATRAATARLEDEARARLRRTEGRMTYRQLQLESGTNNSPEERQYRAEREIAEGRVAAAERQVAQAGSAHTTATRQVDTWRSQAPQAFTGDADNIQTRRAAQKLLGLPQDVMPRIASRPELQPHIDNAMAIAVQKENVVTDISRIENEIRTLNQPKADNKTKTALVGLQKTVNALKEQVKLLAKQAEAQEKEIDKEDAKLEKAEAAPTPAVAVPTMAQPSAAPVAVAAAAAANERLLRIPLSRGEHDALAGEAELLNSKISTRHNIANRTTPDNLARLIESNPKWRMSNETDAMRLMANRAEATDKQRLISESDFARARGEGRVINGMLVTKEEARIHREQGLIPSAAGVGGGPPLLPPVPGAPGAPGGGDGPFDPSKIRSFEAALASLGKADLSKLVATMQSLAAATVTVANAFTVLGNNPTAKAYTEGYARRKGYDMARSEGSAGRLTELSDELDIREAHRKKRQAIRATQGSGRSSEAMELRRQRLYRMTGGSQAELMRYDSMNPEQKASYKQEYEAQYEDNWRSKLNRLSPADKKAQLEFREQRTQGRDRQFLNDPALVRQYDSLTGLDRARFMEQQRLEARDRASQDRNLRRTRSAERLLRDPALIGQYNAMPRDQQDELIQRTRVERQQATDAAREARIQEQLGTGANRASYAGLASPTAKLDFLNKVKNDAKNRKRLNTDRPGLANLIGQQSLEQYINSDPEVQSRWLAEARAYQEEATREVERKKGVSDAAMSQRQQLLRKAKLSQIQGRETLKNYNSNKNTLNDRDFLQQYMPGYVKGYDTAGDDTDRKAIVDQGRRFVGQRMQQEREYSAVGYDPKAMGELDQRGTAQERKDFIDHTRAMNKLKKQSTRDTMREAYGENKYVDKLNANADDTMVGRLGSKFKSLSYYAFAGGAMWSVFAKLKQNLGEVIQLEKDMAAIQGVLINKNPFERMKIEAGVLRAARDFGVNIAEATRQAQLFAQAGMGPDEALKYTRAALSGVTGAGLDPQQSVEMLLAVRNISDGKIGPEEMLDRISRVEAQNAVTAQDLSVAIQRVGSIANELQPVAHGGIDAFDAVNAMTSEIVGQTRVSGNQAATSLRFMLARLAQPRVVNSLQDNFGIKLATDDTGKELRPMLDIMGDIADEYQRLKGEGKTNQANALIGTFAGARQINNAAALFDNWSNVMKTAEQSSMAFGDTQRRTALMMDTVAFRSQEMHNAMVQLTKSVMDSGAAFSLLKMGMQLGTKGMVALAGEGKQGDELAKHSAVRDVSIAVGGLITTKLFAGFASTRYAAARTATMTAQSAGLVSGRFALNAWEALSKIATGLSGATAMFATGASVLLALGGLALYLRKNGEMYRAQWGPAKIDMDLINNSEQAKSYRSKASQLYVDAPTLYAKVNEARRMSLDTTARKLYGDKKTGAELEAEYVNGPTSKTDRRLRDSLEESYVSSLQLLLPHLADVGTEAEQAAFALGLLKDSAINGDMVRGTEMANFREQLNSWKEASVLRSKAQNKTSDNLLRATADGPAIAGMSEGAQPSGMGSRNPSVGDVKNVLSDTLGGAENIATGIANWGWVVKGQSRTIGELAVEYTKSAGTLGKALDQIAREFLTISADNLAAFNKARAELDLKGTLKGKSEGEQTDAVIAQLRAEGKTAAADQYLNQRAFDQRMTKNLASKFDLQGRVDQLNQLDVTETSDGGELFVQKMIDSAERSFSYLLAQVQKAGGNADTQKRLTAYLEALRDKNNDTRGIAKTLDQSKPVAVKDRLLEAFISFIQRREEIIGGGAMLNKGGVGYDRIGEFDRATQDFALRFQRSGSQVVTDLMTLYSKDSQYREQLRNSRTVDPRQILNSPEIDGNDSSSDDQPSRKGADKAEKRISVAELIQGMDSKGRQEVQSKIEATQRELSFITENKELFDSLGPTMQGILTEVVNLPALDAAEKFNFKTLTDQLIPAMIDFSHSMEVMMQREQNLIRLRGEVESQILRTAQERAQIERSNNTSRFTSIYGAAAATPLRYLDIRSRAKDEADEARLQASIQRDEVETRARRMGNKGSREYNSELDIINLRETSAVEAALARGDNRAYELRQQTATDLVARKAQTMDGMLESSTSGLRGLKNWDAVKGPALGARILTPMADTIQEGLSKSFMDTFFGPQGVLGAQLKQLFNQNIFMEAEMIRQAHIEGISLGFAGRGQESFDIGNALPGSSVNGLGLINTELDKARQKNDDNISLTTKWKPLFERKGLEKALYDDNKELNKATFQTDKDLQLPADAAIAAIGATVPALNALAGAASGAAGAIAQWKLGDLGKLDKMAPSAPTYVPPGYFADPERPGIFYPKASVGGGAATAPSAAKIAAAVALAPGAVVIPRLGNQLAYRNNNPGNLRFAGQTGAVSGDKGFARFESPEAGYQALMGQINRDSNRGLNLGQFVNKYAPPSENDTATYLEQMISATGASKATPLKDIDINKLASAVAKKESQTRVGSSALAAGLPASAGVALASRRSTQFVTGRSPYPELSFAGASLTDAFRDTTTTPLVNGADRFGVSSYGGSVFGAGVEAIDAAKLAANGKGLFGGMKARWGANKAQNRAAIGGMIGNMGGSMVGGMIANKMGKDSTGANIGSGLGTVIGTMVGGPVGAAIGGILGGALGGVFGKKKPAEPKEYFALEKIERNTRESVTALENQTRKMAEIDNRMLNVPSSFVVPRYRPLGVGGGAGATTNTFSIEVNVDATNQTNAGDIGAAVASAVRSELSRSGSYTDIRYPR